MPCYYPLDGWRSKSPNERGRYPIVFTRAEAQQDAEVKIACGQCTGCKLEKSRQWAMRCVHEASLHPENSFITLTYNDENLPSNQSLDKREWQTFAKRLRKRLQPKKIRYFMCGEYGTDQSPTSRTIGRPHYHAIIFNHDFPDKKQIKEDLFESTWLNNIWGKGYTTVGAVTFESAAYVARYCLKKITGDEAEQHYQLQDFHTGEITNIKPEYTSQSRNPGIGRKWFEKYRHDLDKGFITMRGIKMPAPKYYHDQYAEHYEADYEPIKEKKRQSIDVFDEENTNNRLRVKERIKLKQIKKLTRTI